MANAVKTSLNKTRLNCTISAISCSRKFLGGVLEKCVLSIIHNKNHLVKLKADQKLAFSVNETWNISTELKCKMKSDLCRFDPWKGNLLFHDKGIFKRLMVFS